MVKLRILFIVLPFHLVFSLDDQKGCGNKPADVEFVLDSSGSILFKDFRKQLQFTKNLVDMFDIGRNKTRVGMVSFSTQVIPEFVMSEYDNKEDIKHRIDNVRYQGGRTYTGDALHYVRTQVFPVDGGRQNVPRISIVLTDGMSQNFEYTIQEAAAAHAQGITIFVIGIGNKVDKKELKAIASQPTDNFMFMIDSFDALQSIKNLLANRTCKVPPATRPPPTMPTISEDAILNGDAHCSPELSIELKMAVDTAAVGIDNSKFILRFIADLSDRLDLQQSHSKIDTVSNGCASQKLGDITFGSGHDREKIETTFMKNTQGISSMMRKMRLSFSRNNRRKKVGVLFMGETLGGNEYSQALRETSRAYYMGIQLFVVGVGDRVTRRQAYFIAKGSNHALFAASYDNLDFVEGPLLLQICKLKP